jgi:hypothetical protein
MKGRVPILFYFSHKVKWQSPQRRSVIKGQRSARGFAHCALRAVIARDRNPHRGACSPDCSAPRPIWTASARRGRALQHRPQRRRQPGVTAPKAAARAKPRRRGRRDFIQRRAQSLYCAIGCAERTQGRNKAIAPYGSIACAGTTAPARGERPAQGSKRPITPRTAPSGPPSARAR